MARVLLHRDPPAANGRPKYFEVVILHGGAELTAKSKEARATAKRLATGLQGRYDGGWEPERPNAGPKPATKETTVGEWVSRWLGKQSYSEAKRDIERVEHWLAKTPKFRDLGVGKVTPKDVAAWLLELRKLPTLKKKPPAPRTVRNVADPVADGSFSFLLPHALRLCIHPDTTDTPDTVSRSLFFLGLLEASGCVRVHRGT